MRFSPGFYKSGCGSLKHLYCICFIVPRESGVDVCSHAGVDGKGFLPGFGVVCCQTWESWKGRALTSSSGSLGHRLLTQLGECTCWMTCQSASRGLSLQQGKRGDRKKDSHWHSAFSSATFKKFLLKYNMHAEKYRNYVYNSVHYHKMNTSV